MCIDVCVVCTCVMCAVVYVYGTQMCVYRNVCVGVCVDVCVCIVTCVCCACVYMFIYMFRCVVVCVSAHVWCGVAWCVCVV